MELTVLYEDEYLLCVIKPTGIPSEGDGMPRLVGEYLSENGGGASPYVGVIHRLDRDVSGAMVFAKREKTAAETVQPQRYCTEKIGTDKNTRKKFTENRRDTNFFKVITT